MLFITEADIRSSLSMKETISVMQATLLKYSKKEYIMPERSFTKIKDEDTFLLMSAAVNDCIGLKVVTSFPSNSSRNKPVTQGFITIHNRETGEALALMNGTFLTAVKTAAVAGVAMKRFKQDATSIGLIGTGLQGLYQLIAALETTNVEKIYLYNRSAEKIPGFIDEFKQLTEKKVEMIIVDSVTELVTQSEIIITATTSTTPVIPNEFNLYSGKLIIGVGSYDRYMRELPENLFRSAPYYFIDSEQGKQECGDIIAPIENGWIDETNVILLSDLLSGEKQLTWTKNEPIVFKTVSMALFDAMIGNYVYKKAVKLGLGMKVELDQK